MMSALRLLFVVFAASWATLASAQGIYTAPGGAFILEWTPTGDPITEVAFRMTGRTLGWLSFCMSTTTHDDADCYVGYVENAQVALQDSYMTLPGIAVTADTVPNIVAGSPIGLEDATETSITFSRLVDTGDTAQDKILLLGDVQFQWAIGTADDYALAKHTNRGSMTLNILAPPTPTPVPVTDTPTPVPTPIVVDTHIRGSHKFDNGAFDLSWEIEKPITALTAIKFTMSAKTLGVISLGLGENHKGMDVYQGMVVNGVAEMRDATVTGKVVPLIDPTSSAIIEMIGGEMSGLTYLVFSRLLLTGDGSDIDIIDSPMTVQYAYSVTDAYAEQHSTTTRGSTILNFITPGNVGTGTQGGGGVDATAAALPLSQGKYEDPTGSFSLSWACVSAECKFTMTGTCTGWVALSFGEPHVAMDTYIGNVVNGVPIMMDGMSNTKGVVPTDEEQNIILPITGTEVTGLLTMLEWKRPFDTKDTMDLPISPGQLVKMAWAISDSDDMTAKHTKAGTFEMVLIENPNAVEGGSTGPKCGNAVFIDAKLATSMEGFFPTAAGVTSPVAIPVGSITATPLLSYKLPEELLVPGTFNIWMEIELPAPDDATTTVVDTTVIANATATDPVVAAVVTTEAETFTIGWTGGVPQTVEIPVGTPLGTKMWIQAKAPDVGGLSPAIQPTMAKAATEMTFTFKKTSKVMMYRWYLGSANDVAGLAGLVGTITSCGGVLAYTPPNDVSGAWMNEAQDFKMEWKISGDGIVIDIAAKATGWAAIGFGPAHKSMDVWGGQYDMAETMLLDGYSTQQSAPIEDVTKNMDSGSIVSQSAGGITRVTIRRKLLTGDKRDVPITKDTLSVSWAMGDKPYMTDNTLGIHKAYGKMEINFFDTVAHTKIGVVGPVDDDDVVYPTKETAIVNVGGGSLAVGGDETAGEGVIGNSNSSSGDDEDDSMMVGGIHVGIVIALAVLVLCLCIGFVKFRINKCAEHEAGIEFQDQCRAIHNSSPGAMGQNKNSYRSSNSHILV